MGETNQNECQQHKELGNKCCDMRNYNDAIKYHKLGTQMDGSSEKIALHSNAALCYAKIESQDNARLECNKGLELSGKDNTALIAKLC